MFYSQCLVSRKGPLGAIWVAAYFFKKLKKAQVKDTHIPTSIDQILQKELDALTYRVLAYLLLGVVRIYSKKVDFLFDDCNKALIGVKEFVAKEKNREKTAVPLPASAGCFSIVLPERFELDAFDLGILEDFHGGNVKPLEDITLRDGSQETDSMDQYSMERFDIEEDLLFTFHETFSADRDKFKHESFAHDIDMDAENDRDATQEASVRIAEAEPLEFTEASRVHQNASRHREDPEPNDILLEPQMSEDIRRAQEEDSVRETIGTIVQRLVGPHESSRDNLHRDGHKENSEPEKTSVETSCEKMNHESSRDNLHRDGQKENSEPEKTSVETSCEKVPHESSKDNLHRDGHKENIEPEKTSVETSCEKMQHDGFLLSESGSPEVVHGIEEQPSSTTRNDGEKEIPEMSTLEESEPGHSEVEKCRGHCEVEMVDFEMFHGSRNEQSETSELNLNSSKKDFLSDMTVPKDTRGFNATDTPVAVTPKTPLRLKISEGEKSPQFLIIPTPAAKESSRVSRKRKCLIDDEVLIPNKVMKKMIEDSSTLISKRKNVLQTDDPERRTKRFADPSRIFLDSLIPFAFLSTHQA